jgi:hypothetical protein
MFDFHSKFEVTSTRKMITTSHTFAILTHLLQSIEYLREDRKKSLSDIVLVELFSCEEDLSSDVYLLLSVDVDVNLFSIVGTENN